jgi:two-component system, cell cycle sensor histidine kinase and response regulator CckA
MKAISFEHQIQSAQHRLQAMQELSDNSPSSSKELQNEAIAEFSITLEELHVASEELKAQNEKLLVSNQMLALERQRYRELFDFAPDGYLVTNVQGVIQQANCAATALLNLRQDLIVGKPLIVFVEKNSQISFHTQLERLTQNDCAITDWEVNLKPRNKPPFPISISVSKIYYDPHGQLSGFRWLIRDLSHRKADEQTIKEQAELLNVATDAILVHSLENQVLFWNKGAEKLYGWTATEARGKNILGLLYRDPTAQAEARLNEALMQNGACRGELEQTTRSDRDVIVESHWTLVRDEAGEPKSVLIVNTDITEKKQIESQLFQCQREESLGTLSRGIAHDLNNILTPILGIAQLLPLKFPSANEHTLRLIHVLETSTKRAIDLVQQVQLFAGGDKGERAVLLVGALISDLEGLTEKIFPKSIVFHTEIAPDLWCVEGNSVQLNQVLVNLCVNARDAMPNGGILNLSARNLVINESNIQIHPDANIGPYVVITVMDNGLGIPADVVNRIFEPFFTTKTEDQGSGLGLSILAGIVRNHDGFVTVSSRVGKGSQFEIYLPALKTMAISLEEELNFPRGNAELILVVDDEVTILESSKLLLENFGYQVLTAEDGLEALSLYQQQQDKISVVLMDMMMPYMDGETAILGLRAINPQVKIIANSGLALSHQPSLGHDLKVNAFLYKPYPADVLLTVLRDVIGQSSTVE